MRWIGSYHADVVAVEQGLAEFGFFLLAVRRSLTVKQSTDGHQTIRGMKEKERQLLLLPKRAHTYTVA